MLQQNKLKFIKIGIQSSLAAISHLEPIEWNYNQKVGAQSCTYMNNIKRRKNSYGKYYNQELKILFKGRAGNNFIPFICKPEILPAVWVIIVTVALFCKKLMILTYIDIYK